jgi:antitoxin component YwqK of YwqJK toxin-antitoxin module
MKKTIKVLYLTIFLLSFYQMSSQKVEREYYNNFKVKYEWQVNPNGIKNGYFRSYASDGTLYEKGVYKNGLKTGTWISYGIEQGHPNEVSSSMEYLDGKMNGKYIQYCWNKGVRYVCGDYFYKNDEEITALKYHSNGKLQYKIDREKGIYEEWFSDGKPAKETINGKRYLYEFSGETRYVREISYDSLDYTVFINYPSKSLRSVQYYQKSTKCLRCGDLIKEYDYNYISDVKLIESNKTITLDSISLREAYKLYSSLPNPNQKNYDSPYDFKTGNIINKNSNGSYKVTHINKSGLKSFRFYNVKNEIESEELENGTISYFKNNIIYEQTGPGKSWTREFDSNGILIKEYSRQYVKKYYPNGKLMLEIGYTNNKVSDPVNNSYFENGKIKTSLISQVKNLYDSNYTGFEFDIEGKIISVLVFKNWDDELPTEKITDNFEMAKKLNSAYNEVFLDYNKKINQYFKFIIAQSNDETYPNLKFASDLVNKLIGKYSNNVLYSNKINQIFENNSLASFLVKNLDKIIIPENEDTKKIIMKSKDDIEILKSIGIPYSN